LLPVWLNTQRAEALINEEDYKRMRNMTTNVYVYGEGF
jgi:hypothetical protein